MKLARWFIICDECEQVLFGPTFFFYRANRFANEHERINRGHRAHRIASYAKHIAIPAHSWPKNLKRQL